MDAAPQAFQALHAVLGQPRLEFAVGTHLLLQGFQGLDAGAQVGQAGRLSVHGGLAGAAVFVQGGHLFLQVLQPGLRFSREGFSLGQLFLQLLQACFIGRGQSVAVGQQPFAAVVLLTRLFFDVALVCGEHANLLLDLHHRGALAICVVLRFKEGFFQVGQGHGLVFNLRCQRHALVFGRGRLFRQSVQLGQRVLAAGAPVRSLLHQLLQALLCALAAFDHEPDFGFELSDLGTGFVQFALGLVDLVTCGVMRLADGFQVGLDVPQIGHARFQRIDRMVNVRLHAALVGLSVASLQEPQLVLLERAVGLQVVVTLGHFGLLFQLFQIGVQLAQDVIDPGQVFAGVRQTVFGLTAALFVLGHACSFFEKQAQLLRSRLDNAANGALANDGVSAWTQASAQKHVLHIAAAHRLIIDVVAAVAVTGQHTLDRDLGKLAPLAPGAVVGIVKYQLHAGATGGFAGVGAVENDVLHGFTTQLGSLGLAQHPAHRVHDVGFATAVGPDHAHQLPGQQEVGRFSERFEARKLDGIEAHSG